jgi:hypothetical protein
MPHEWLLAAGAVPLPVLTDSAGLDVAAGIQQRLSATRQTHHDVWSHAGPQSAPSLLNPP